MTEPEWMDGEYPSPEAIERIRTWEGTDFDALLAFVKSVWHWPDWGWNEHDGEERSTKQTARVYQVSTGGWSGNEELIGALRESKSLFWMFCWYQSRRGGHFEFRITRQEPTPHQHRIEP